MVSARLFGYVRARLHYGDPRFGYALALVLTAVMGTARLALIRSGGNVHGPFFLFYPAIGMTAYLAGMGPALLCVGMGAVFAVAFFPTEPGAFNWLMLAILSPFFILGFANLRLVGEVRARATRELERFQFIGRHVTDWIFLIDANGVIEYSNEAAANHLGYRATELVGMQLRQLMPDDQREQLTELLQKCNPGAAPARELTLRRHDGSLVTVEAGCTGVMFSKALVIHLAARDITERRQMEQKLRDVRQWENLGVMAGGLAHDFNNLLTSIMGNAELAKCSLEPEHPLVPLLESIEQAGERSAELIRLMLATAAYRPRQVERLRMDRLLDDLLVNKAIPAHVAIERNPAAADHPPDDLHFFGDEKSMQTLLWSLISNAVESYGEAPGETSPAAGPPHPVKVELQRSAVPAVAAGDFEEGDFANAPGGNYLGISVEDRGCGMNTEVLERAFNPFYTTKFTGRGLGLPAVRGLVRAYSGKIWLKTAPGAGTRVVVWLPVAEPKGMSATRTSSARP